MHRFYQFDFLATITRQLKEGLDSLTPTLLNIEALKEILATQAEHKTKGGVYVIYYEELPVYAGKADALEERLSEHWEKLSGRAGIDLTKVKYKALLLDRSMSTAANEKLLIAMYKARKECAWNLKGFGPKDPGKERDTQKPNWFDLTYPILRNLPLKDILETETVQSLLSKLKAGLPYLVRWDKDNLTVEEQALLVGVNQGEVTGEALLKRVCEVLGEGWQAVALSYGLILYKDRPPYRYGEKLHPLP